MKFTAAVASSSAELLLKSKYVAMVTTRSAEEKEESMSIPLMTRKNKFATTALLYGGWDIVTRIVLSLVPIVKSWYVPNVLPVLVVRSTPNALPVLVGRPDRIWLDGEDMVVTVVLARLEEPVGTTYRCKYNDAMIMICYVYTLLYR